MQEKAVLRQFISIGGEIVTQGFNPKCRLTHELLMAAEQRIFAAQVR